MTRLVSTIIAMGLSATLHLFLSASAAEIDPAQAACEAVARQSVGTGDTVSAINSHISGRDVTLSYEIVSPSGAKKQRSLQCRFELDAAAGGWGLTPIPHPEYEACGSFYKE